MNSHRKQEDYAKKINRVCDYIYANLDANLTVEKLSRLVHFSPFHFHRQFSLYTGISLYKYIQLLRLKRASYQLVFNKHLKVIDIALQAKFENPESFSRAFKKAFSQSPMEFRHHPKWEVWKEKYHFTQTRNFAQLGEIMKVSIVEFNDTRVAALEHRNAPALLNNSVSRFIEWRKQSKLSPVDSMRTFGVAYDDPKTTPDSEFRFDICGEILAPVEENPQGVINKHIPGGRCALLRHNGSHDGIDEKIYYLYGDWLPECGEELRDFPCFMHYLNFFPDVPEHELLTDIYLPLK